MLCGDHGPVLLGSTCNLSECHYLYGSIDIVGQTMNCHAPEPGNIELLAKCCNEEQKRKWLQPLLDGAASSAFFMTEPDVASFDAKQIDCRIGRDGDEYVINGRKLYGNCLWNSDLKLYVFMACSDPTNPND